MSGFFHNLYKKIPSAEQEVFQRELLELNFSRLIIIAITCFGTELIILLISELVSVSAPEILCFVAVNIILLPVLFHLKTYITRVKSIYIKTFQYIYTAVILAFGVSLSIGSQDGSMRVYLYVMFVFAVSSMIYMKPIERAVFLSAAYIIFSLLFSASGPGIQSAFLILLNTFIFNLFSWVQADIVYRMKQSDFLNRKEIEQKNLSLEDSARRDSMTGLYNHEAAFEQLQSEIALALATGSPLSIIIADIDDFKNVNDRYGHLTGDKVIKSVAGAIVSAMSGSGIVGRYGGEEFIIIMPETDFSQANVKAQQIQNAIRELAVDEKIKVTLSGGLRTYAGETFDEFIRKTDIELYNAKKSGKNKFAFDDGMVYS